MFRISLFFKLRVLLLLLFFPFFVIAAEREAGETEIPLVIHVELSSLNVTLGKPVAITVWTTYNNVLIYSIPTDVRILGPSQKKLLPDNVDTQTGQYILSFTPYEIGEYTIVVEVEIEGIELTRSERFVVRESEHSDTHSETHTFQDSIPNSISSGFRLKNSSVSPDGAWHLIFSTNETYRFLPQTPLSNATFSMHCTNGTIVGDVIPPCEEITVLARVPFGETFFLKSSDALIPLSYPLSERIEQSAVSIGHRVKWRVYSSNPNNLSLPSSASLLGVRESWSGKDVMEETLFSVDGEYFTSDEIQEAKEYITQIPSIKATGNFAYLRTSRIALLRYLLENTSIPIRVHTENTQGIFIEYETPAPELKIVRENRSGFIMQKDFVISSETHYINVRSEISLPDLLPDQITNARLLWHTPEKSIDVLSDSRFHSSFKDNDNDGDYDALSWITPHLSEQNFTLILDLTILNIKSYPTVGGMWTVNFTTSGKENLTITPFNFTSWTEMMVDSSSTQDDLFFTRTLCGNLTILPTLAFTNASWIPYHQLSETSYSKVDSLLFESWECNETARLENRVLTPGDHHIFFEFGHLNASAHNFAVPGILSVTMNTPSTASVIKTFQNFTFLVNATIFCEGNPGASCGNVSSTLVFNASAAREVEWINESYLYRRRVNFVEPLGYAFNVTHVLFNLTLDVNKLTLDEENSTALYCGSDRVPFDGYGVSRSGSSITFFEGLASINITQNQNKSCYLYYGPSSNGTEFALSSTGWMYAEDNSFSACSLAGSDITTPDCFENFSTVSFTSFDVCAQGAGSSETFLVNTFCYFRAPFTRSETFGTRSDDSSYLYVNGTLVVDHGTGCQAPTDSSGTYSLRQGYYYLLRGLMNENGGGEVFHVFYNSTTYGGTGRNTIDTECFPAIGDEFSIRTTVFEEELLFYEFSPINTTNGQLPFFTTSSQPQYCLLNTTGNCTVQWTVNATGPIGSLYKLQVNVSSNESMVSQSRSANATMNITLLSGGNLTWDRILLNLSTGSLNLGNLTGTATLFSGGDNENITLTCLSGDCAMIDHNLTTLVNLSLGHDMTVRFYCSDSQVGSFMAEFGVNSSQDTSPELLNVSCVIQQTYGVISLSLHSPMAGVTTNVTRYGLFSFNVTASCNGTPGSICGNVSVLALYNQSLPMDLWYDTSYRYRVQVNISENAGYPYNNTHVLFSVIMDTSRLSISGENGTLFICDDARVPADGYSFTNSGGWITKYELLASVNISAFETTNCYLYYDPVQSTTEFLPSATGWRFFEQNKTISASCTQSESSVTTPTCQEDFSSLSFSSFSTCVGGAGSAEHFLINAYCYYKSSLTKTETFGTRSDDASWLYINNTLVVNHGDGCQGEVDASGTYSVVTGRYYDLRALYNERTGDEVMHAFYNSTTYAGAGRNDLDVECYPTIGGSFSLETSVGSEQSLPIHFVPINTTNGDVPLFTLQSQPQFCFLNASQNCTLNWTVNATGLAGTMYLLKANISSNYTSISSNESLNATILIINRANITNISLSGAPFYVGIHATIASCEVRDHFSGSALSDFNVTFYRNGSSLGSARTNSSGQANMTFTPLAVGEFNISCIISDDPSTSYVVNPSANMTSGLWNATHVPISISGPINGTIVDRENASSVDSDLAAFTISTLEGFSQQTITVYANLTAPSVDGQNNITLGSNVTDASGNATFFWYPSLLFYAGNYTIYAISQNTTTSGISYIHLYGIFNASFESSIASPDDSYLTDENMTWIANMTSRGPENGSHIHTHYFAFLQAAMNHSQATRVINFTYHNASLTTSRFIAHYNLTNDHPLGLWNISSFLINGSFMYSHMHFLQRNFSHWGRAFLTLFDGRTLGFNENITCTPFHFYANYTNSTGSPIVTGTCQINFTDLSSQSMVYTLPGVYNYSRSSEYPGILYWNVTCFAPTYQRLIVTNLSWVAQMVSTSSSLAMGPHQASNTYTLNRTLLNHRNCTNNITHLQLLINNRSVVQSLPQENGSFLLTQSVVGNLTLFNETLANNGTKQFSTNVTYAGDYRMATQFLLAEG